MPSDCFVRILLAFTLIYFSVKDIKGNTQGHGKEFINVTRGTIEDLRQNLKRILHFVDYVSEDIAKTSKLAADDKSRSVIPPDRTMGAQWLADESVVKATARKASKAVKDSLAATLKTQKGVKQVSKGLVKLKECLEKFEDTIKV